MKRVKAARLQDKKAISKTLLEWEGLFLASSAVCLAQAKGKKMNPMIWQ